LADMILGVGHQKSLSAVVDLAEAYTKKAQGAPRQIVVNAPGIEVHALRAGYEGPFDTFKVRLKADEKLISSAKQLAADVAVHCTVAEQDGKCEFSCLASSEGSDATRDVIDRLSALLHLPEIWRIRGENFRREHVSTEALFQAMVKFKASDVHLYPNATPVFRVDNDVHRSEMHHPLSAPQILDVIRDIAPERDWNEFQEHHQCSFTFHQLGLGYARVSAFIRSGVPHCTFRFLPETIPSFEDLNIPAKTMEKLGKQHFGLILVTGMTGSGKSTTVASLIDWINTNSARHVLTIEDPVEYVHKNKKAIVSQRRVGLDVDTFHEAVRAALRQDPDVIFIGEMRDTDTIRSAISAASTGHLVVSTLHANTASEVVTRIVSFFDPVERDLVKLQLRDSIRCIICQRLLAKIGGGRVPALEFLFNDTNTISDYIMTGDALGIRVGMQQTFSDSFIVEEYLLGLAKKEVVSWEEARANIASPETFDQMRQGTYKPPSLDTMKH